MHCFNIFASPSLKKYTFPVTYSTALLQISSFEMHIFQQVRKCASSNVPTNASLMWLKLLVQVYLMKVQCGGVTMATSFLQFANLHAFTKPHKFVFGKK